MIERYTLRVYDNNDDAKIFQGHFKSFHKCIHFASAFDVRYVDLEITDNFKEVVIDQKLVTSLIYEVMEGFRVYEICD